MGLGDVSCCCTSPKRIYHVIYAKKGNLFSDNSKYKEKLQKKEISALGTYCTVIPAQKGNITSYMLKKEISSRRMKIQGKITEIYYKFLFCSRHL